MASAAGSPVPGGSTFGIQSEPELFSPSPQPRLGPASFIAHLDQCGPVCPGPRLLTSPLTLCPFCSSQRAPVST